MFRRDRITGNRGGGVLLYARDSVNATEVQVESGFGEHVWCQIGELLVGVIYRSNNTRIVGQDNNKNLLELLTKVCDKQVLILGDFNYPDIDWCTYTASAAASRDCCEFINTIEDCFYTQHVLSPTRDDAILDLVLSREPDLVSQLQVINSLGDSDHNMIEFTFHMSRKVYNDTKEMRDYRCGDYDSIKKCLSLIDWDIFLNGDTVTSWNKFKALLLDLINNHVPKKVLLKKNKFKKPIWMTHRAVKLVTAKRKTFHKYKDTTHPAVKAANRAAKKELRRSVKNFEKKLAQNIKKDRKSFFAYIRGKTKSKVHTGPLLDSTGKILDSPMDMVQEFNSYFASVFTSENISILPYVADMFCGAVEDKCQDVYFSQDDVLKVLSNLREDKAAGADDLSPRFLLHIKEQISYPLFLIFRKSLDEGVVPEDWKLSNVSPIYKKGNRNQAENYRPVSLTSVICKLFESIMRDTLVHHLEEKLLIGSSQHGFRKGRSCLTNLLAFLDKVTDLVDSGNSIDVVFLDFAKAFDKVPHKRLIIKLESHGITGKVSQWVREWLKERMQRVCINGVTSSWLEVMSGVPQGSVLGPILFLIYINDLDNGIKNWILKFADDTKIFSAVNNDSDRRLLQKDLDNLDMMAEEWQMMFSFVEWYCPRKWFRTCIVSYIH